mgnify:FL=1
MPPLSSLISQKWPDIQIDAPLGSGACGTVYACTKKSAVTGIESREAVKVVRVEFSAAAHRQAEEEGIPFDEYYARTKAEKSREIELLVNLKSPHIVHINEFDAVEEPDHSAFYLLIRMDLLQALTAFRVDHLTDTPEQAGAYARKVMLDICDALRVCHENGICHRDIKPANILYGATGDFYLGDFGVSQYTAAPDATLTSSGTARYAAPEQLIGRADSRSDLYSLGLVLYELTNHWRGPFLPAYPAKITAEDRYNAQCKRLAGDALPPPDNCPPALAAVILKLCAPDPGDRYQTVQEVLDALSPAAAPTTTQKKKPRRLWIGVGLVVAAVAVAGLTARVSMVQRVDDTGTEVEVFDTTVWDYARKNGITVSDATHVDFNGGAYNYPCQTSGFYEYFEPDGVTDWGATRLSATVTGAEKSDPDADGNVTYTVTCAARTRMDFTVAEGAEPFLPGLDLRVLELMDLRSGYTFPLRNLNGPQETTPRSIEVGGDYTFSYQRQPFPVQVARTEQWEYTLPDYTVPGAYQTQVVVYYTYTVTVPHALDSLALYIDTTPYTGYSRTLDTAGKTLDQQDSFTGFENYEFFALDDVVSDFADLPGTEAPDAGSYLEKMGARFTTETSFTVPNGAAGYPTNPYRDFDPFRQEDIGEGNSLAFGPGNADVTITGVTRSDPDADGSLTYTVAFDTTATLQYGFPKSLRDDGTITELGMGRCFAGFGLLDAQTGTVFAPQQGAGSWPWSVPYLGYNCYTVVLGKQPDPDNPHGDAPDPTRDEPCQLVRPLTTYTLDDGRTCRLGFAEVGSWDFGQTQVGQVDHDGTPWVLAVNKSTMHGVLQIKVDAGYDDLVLYYNAQGFGENDVFSYDVWAGDGEDGPLYLDELGYFKGMQGMRFYRLDELVSLFAEGS